ncbi:MAG: cysteine desulfurase family protein [Candidatus Cloacimonetes bacterium]|jgi:cysteine desulfurase|nr:cysteine desulfurase family protein [Candidatus Cloacimonadota bacterium]
MERIYFNNCLTSKPAPEVVKITTEYMKNKYYFPENFNAMGTEASDNLERAIKIIADSMGANSKEVHFTSGGTAANNLAIKGYLTANSNKGTHIICSVIDYPDILTNAAFFEKSGFEVTYLQADNEGFIDLVQLKNSIREDTILFMTTLGNHTVGTIQPIKEIREILDNSEHKIAMHVDACEAYARIPINVNELGIDLMSISAHKIHGPQGIGALYQRKGITLGQVQHGVNRMDNLQTGGMNIASIAGFAKAVELAFNNFEENMAKIRKLSDYLLNKIESTIPDTLLNGPRGVKRTPHNINISFDYIEGEAIMMMMDIVGVSISTGSACASQGLKPNYVLMALGRSHEQSHSSMKFTFSRYNTIEEIDYTVEKLAEVVKELRSRSPLYN